MGVKYIPKYWEQHCGGREKEAVDSLGTGVGWRRREGREGMGEWSKMDADFKSCVVEENPKERLRERKAVNIKCERRKGLKKAK